MITNRTPEFPSLIELAKTYGYQKSTALLDDYLGQANTILQENTQGQKAVKKTHSAEGQFKPKRSHFAKRLSTEDITHDNFLEGLSTMVGYNCSYCAVKVLGSAGSTKYKYYITLPEGVSLDANHKLFKANTGIKAQIIDGERMGNQLKLTEEAYQKLSGRDPKELNLL